jgi:hypothetical protein
LDEEEDQDLQKEITPVDRGPVMTVEISTSTKSKSPGEQSETESLTTNQPIDYVNQFMEIRQAGAKIKKNITPHIFEYDASQARMISVVDYEKGKLNIVVIEQKEKKKVTNVSIDLNAVHPLENLICTDKLEK